MLKQYKGRLLSSVEPTTSASSASGMWTLEEYMQAKQAGLWPSGAGLFNFTSFTFTHGNQNGPIGPTLAQLSYDTITHPFVSNPSYFSVTSGIQYFTVPATGLYDIEVAGASSVRQVYSSTSSNTYGRGARFKIRTQLTSGQILKILIGQLPSSAQNYGSAGNPYTGQSPTDGNCFAGGGGATIIALDDNTPIVVAGAGGSNRTQYPCNSQTNIDASTNLSASPTWPGNPGGNGGSPVAGGTSGLGGVYISSDQGTAGAGFTGNGDQGASVFSGYTSARSFVNGGSGAIAVGIGSNVPQPSGGFGGGGAGGWGGSGGGGGYSGGGAGSNNGSDAYGGGGSNFIRTGSTVVTGHSYHTGSGFATITAVVA
jgi:hypothetical protein